MNFSDLYKKISDIPIGDFPSSALSGLLHGYISVFSMVRVNPWLEEVYGSQWDIHERIREIAGELADLVNDPSISLEERVVHVADLLETYLMYSDMDFLDIALDAAYGIISPEGGDEIVLPCRTPEMCRLLCSCYYFTGEERCAELAGEIVNRLKACVLDKSLDDENALIYLLSMEFYVDIVGEGEDWKHVISSLKANVLQLLEKEEIHESLLSQVFYFNVFALHEYMKLGEMESK